MIFMRKWITVKGKKMDSVEFTRFIREKVSKQMEAELKRRKHEK